MQRWLRRLGAAGVWFVLSLGIAQAHPLGNFTINHLTIVRPERARLSVTYVLDIAEIPAFQLLHARGDAWSADQLAIVRDAVRVDIDGVPQTMEFGVPQARTRPGAGGLPTLYWSATARLPFTGAAPHRIEIRDSAYPGRIGWKDIVVWPQADPTHALTSYPPALLGSPRANDEVRFTVDARGRAREIVAGESAPQERSSSAASILVGRGNPLSDLFARPDQSPLLAMVTVLLAFGLGSLHGLEPGHGKALLAFTLVGSRATFKQAAILAAALTFAHTIAVLALGAALFFVAGFASESVFTWITLISGGAVAIIGARTLNSAIAHRRQPHDHEHVHALASGGTLRFSSAVVAAMSGGIAPCPAAIVVLLAALRLHRVGYGIALIVIFSLGLAAMLTAIGFAVVHGAAWLRRSGKFDGIARYAPLLTGAVISIAGACMLAQGFAQQGIAVSSSLVIALALVAIAGYAFVPAHQHGRTAHDAR